MAREAERWCALLKLATMFSNVSNVSRGQTKQEEKEIMIASSK